MRARDDIEALDRDDPLAHCRHRFHIPAQTIYLDGNSLGPVPKNVLQAVQQTIDEQWREGLIRSWNQHGWIDLPERVGNRIAPIIGAAPDTVTLTDTLSLNVVKALSAALNLRPGRRVVLSDAGNFPSDLYMAQGLLRALDRELELRIVDPENVAEAIDEQVAAVMLTEVDYRTGRLHDMADITARTRAAGAVSIWDLAHSAGALPVYLDANDVDFAVGCTYKYLNGGPGAPGFIYVKSALQGEVWPLLSGWLGHASPFAFELDYSPSPGIRRMRVGTPPVIALAALDAALDVWDDVDLGVLRSKSCALGDLFIDEVEARCQGLGLTLASPREAQRRGSQVSLRCEHAYEVMQALIYQGVIGAFRAPDNLRFGFAPLYLRYADVVQAAASLEDVLRKRLWDLPQFQQRGGVT